MTRIILSRACVASALLALVASPLAAQSPFAITVPNAAVTVARDVRYATDDTTVLRMDVYRASGPRGAARPALLFFNRATGAERSGDFYSAWARAAAARGLVAILPDLRDGNEPRDFRALVTYVTGHARELGVESTAIAVYAGSGNVYAALPTVEDTSMRAIAAAIMYYGTAPVERFRLDLPLLWVRAGLDRPGLNAIIDSTAARAIAQNAPVILRNHTTGHHAFEMADADSAAAAVIEQTIAFVKQTTSPRYRSALLAGIPEAEAAGHVRLAQYVEAAAIYGELVRAHPDDLRLRLSYGESLLGAARYADACAEFDKLRGKGLGPRDLGLPAARACMQSGNADAAIAWLQSIPTRFRPNAVQNERVFAAIRDRADFRALWQSTP